MNKEEVIEWINSQEDIETLENLFSTTFMRLWSVSVREEISTDI